MNFSKCSLIVSTAAFLFMLQGVTVAMAVPVPSGTPILIVDGTTELNGATNTTVTPTIVNPIGGFNFGQVIGGVFSAIVSDVTALAGGSLVDFAIQDQSNPANVFSLTDPSPNVVVATLSGPNLTGNEEVPAVVPAYYNTLDLVWTIGGNLFNVQVLNAGPNTDGFAAIPIPPAVFLFGSGLIGLIGIARRKLLV